MRRLSSTYLFAFVCTWAVTLIPCAYFVYQQTFENKVLDSYLARHQLLHLPLSKAAALLISDTVRSRFQCEGKYLHRAQDGRAPVPKGGFGLSADP